MQAKMDFADWQKHYVTNNTFRVRVLFLLITALRSELQSEPSPAVKAISTE